MSPLQWTLFNIIGFQIGWFGCVLGAAWGLPWLGPVVVAAVLAPQFRRHAPGPRMAAFVAAVVGLGALAEGLHLLSGAFALTNAALLPLPLWLLAMWVNFTPVLDEAMSWLRGRYLLGAVLGAIFGPLAYLGGAELGAIVLHPASWRSLGVIGVVWALAMPLILLLHRRIIETPGAPVSASA